MFEIILFCGYLVAMFIIGIKENQKIQTKAKNLESLIESEKEKNTEHKISEFTYKIYKDHIEQTKISFFLMKHSLNSPL